MAASVLGLSAPLLREKRRPGGEFHDPDGHLDAAYAMADGDMLLVRPDGYVAVAARASAAEGARLAGYLAVLRLCPATT